MSYERLKVNLLVAADERFHVDTVDMYSSRQRSVFVRQASAELGCAAEALKKELGRVFLKLEELQHEQIAAALAPKAKSVAMSPEDEAEAIKLLEDPRLLDRISTDLEACGLVGEHTNKLVAYLAAISRKLDKPLGVMVQSSSAAGKSALMEAVLAFCPKEDRVQYSAMTGQSLFYMGETDLKHKVLAIAEEEGAERASYPLKLLQSEGELTIASTGKDPKTGRLTTHEYHVEGPAAILLTTTAIDLDEELQNRCVVLAVDESREQTIAIHEAQRLARTRDGAVQRKRRPRIRKLHCNAQRLLRPIGIRNPYSPRLTFPNEATRSRRDQEKYLALIDAIALVHQHQRTITTDLVDGERDEYIEVTLDDIAVANRLASEALGRTLDELPPQTRRLLLLVHEMVSAECEKRKLEHKHFRFTRRQVRERTGLGNTQLKLHLRRLVEMEYLLVHIGSHGQRFLYELLYDGEGKEGEPFVLGLFNIDRLRQEQDTGAYDPNRSGSEPNRSGQNLNRSARGRPVVGGWSGGGRSDLAQVEKEDNPGNQGQSPKNAHLGIKERRQVAAASGSYMPLAAKARGGE
jgi:DNA primase